jgi:hypothetical protein
MKRRTTFVAVSSLLFLVTPSILAQESPNRPIPPGSSETLGVQLVVWSKMQQPQPLQQGAEGSPNSERPSADDKSMQKHDGNQQPSAVEPASPQIRKDADVSPAPRK